MDQAYIEDHIGEAHDWDSWGRAIFEQALNEAKKKLGRKSTDVVELSAKVRVSPVPAVGKPRPGERKPRCIKVEIDIGDSSGGIKWHNKEYEGRR